MTASRKTIYALIAGTSLGLIACASAPYSSPAFAQEKPNIAQPAAHAQEQPNIVLVFMDNFGWGEPGFNGGGIIRGAATPRIDQLAAEGIRLTNFNVESQCTPSRAAIMSGRYAIRTGNGTVPLGGGVYGLVQWEITMAEMLGRRGLRHRHVRQVASRPHRRPVPDRPGLRRVVRHPELER